MADFHLYDYGINIVCTLTQAGVKASLAGHTVSFVITRPGLAPVTVAPVLTDDGNTCKATYAIPYVLAAANRLLAAVGTYSVEVIAENSGVTRYGGRFKFTVSG